MCPTRGRATTTCPRYGGSSARTCAGAGCRHGLRAGREPGHPRQRRRRAHRTAGRLPDHLALVDGDRRWTYRQLDERVNRVANGLIERGYARGDALALASGNSAEFLVRRLDRGREGRHAASPDVAEVAVVGLPHERWTAAITAVVVPKPGATLDGEQLLAAVRASIAGFKAPKTVIVVDELPKTSTGKIQKNVVRTKFADFYSQ